MPVITSNTSDPPQFASSIANNDGTAIKTEESIDFTGWSGTLPSGATITGVQIIADCAIDPLVDGAAANSVWTITIGSDTSDAITPDTSIPSPLAFAEVTWGSDATLWGLGSNIWNNDISFSDITVTFNTPGSNVFYIDQLQMKIHYTTPSDGSPIKLLEGYIQLINGRISI